MLRYFAFLFLAFLGLLLESTWLSGWPSETLRFDIVWVLILYLGFTTNLHESGLLVLSLGLMADIAGSPFLGFFATVYFAIFCLLRSVIAHIFVETLWARLLWVAILSLLATFGKWGLMAVMGRGPDIDHFLLTYGLLQPLVTMVLAACLFPLLERIDGFLYGYRYGT